MPLDLKNARGLAVLRISVGVLFAMFGEYKVFGTGFTFGGGLQFWIDKFLDGGVYPFMAPVLRDFVLPHGTAIAFLVAYGEFAIGLSLILGVWVRWASVGGVIYMLTLIFASNYPGAQAPFWQYFGASTSHSVFALCFVAFFMGDSERIWSLAAMRRARMTRT
jgi:thiosulfate dehydrogenase [quinone] large subunit